MCYGHKRQIRHNQKQTLQPILSVSAALPCTFGILLLLLRLHILQLEGYTPAANLYPSSRNKNTLSLSRTLCRPQAVIAPVRLPIRQPSAQNIVLQKNSFSFFQLFYSLFFMLLIHVLIRVFRVFRCSIITYFSIFSHLTTDGPPPRVPSFRGVRRSRGVCIQKHIPKVLISGIHIRAGSASGIHTPPLPWHPFQNLIFAIAK